MNWVKLTSAVCAPFHCNPLQDELNRRRFDLNTQKLQDLVCWDTRSSRLTLRDHGNLKTQISVWSLAAGAAG